MPVTENGLVVLSPTRRKRDPGTAATAPTECEVDQARQNELCHAVGLGTWSRYREEERRFVVTDLTQTFPCEVA
jgi:hypothetical protein